MVSGKHLRTRGFVGKCRGLAGPPANQHIPVDVEAAEHVDLRLAHVLAGEIEQVVRAQLQIRVSVSVLAPGQLPRAVYKNAILAVRGAS